MNREEIIAAKVAKNVIAMKYLNVAAIRKELETMLFDIDDWVDSEKEAIEDGRASFNYSRYFITLRNALHNAYRVARDVEKST